MNVEELRERIVLGENLHTDLKQAVPDRNELAKDLVCFANTDGGQLIIGVADDGTIVGLDDSDVATRTVEEVATQRCAPPITIVQEVLEVDSRAVLVLSIPKGDSRPYRTGSGQYYVRAYDRCRQASREELLRLFQETQSLFYDETPMTRLEISDLDLDAVADFLERTGQQDLGDDLPIILRNWRLYDGHHPTIAGVVLFGRRPQEHLPHAQINAAAWSGVDSSEEPNDRVDLQGKLLDVIAQAERFLGIHLRTPHRIEGFEPEARPELPLEALREAVVNAVSHRDYTVVGPVRLFVFDDRVEVHTPGRAPNTVDEGAMRAGVHIVRNPHLYARLSDAGLVTRAGTGVRRMSRLLLQSSGEELSIVLSGAEVMMSLPRPSATP